MLRHSIAMVGAFLALPLVGCRGEGGTMNDFSTPEKAIVSLENAYRAGDLEAAIRCKDFKIEARLMLESISKLPKDQIDDELVGKTAEVLELGYRTEIKGKGLPDMRGVRSTFPNQEPGGKNIVIVTEVCHYPDGGTSSQKILVAKTEQGWRVLNPVNDR